MKTYNIHWTKTHLSQLLEMAVQGEPFIIAKAGKPMVKVEALGSVDSVPVRRGGFMKGEFTVPEDFDTMFQKEIEEMFYGPEP